MIRIQSKSMPGLILDIPEKVEEITIGQFVALRELAPDDLISVVSVLSKTPLEQLSSCRYNPLEAANIWSIFDNLRKDVDRYMSPGNAPERFKELKEVTIMDKAIKVPQDIFKYAYWSTRKGAMMVQDAIKVDGVIDLTDKYPELIAHYLYCPFTEMKYNEDRAKEFIEVINDMPLTTAIQLGNFIILDLRSFWQTSYLKYLSTWMRTSRKLIQAALFLFRKRTS